MSSAATGLDFPFRETFEELIALAKQWEGEAKDAQDSLLKRFVRFGQWIGRG